MWALPLFYEIVWNVSVLFHIRTKPKNSSTVGFFFNALTNSSVFYPSAIQRRLTIWKEPLRGDVVYCYCIPSEPIYSIPCHFRSLKYCWQVGLFCSPPLAYSSLVFRGWKVFRLTQVIRFNTGVTRWNLIIDKVRQRALMVPHGFEIYEIMSMKSQYAEGISRAESSMKLQLVGDVLTKHLR